MQTTAIRTVAYSLPENEVILLTHLISMIYISYTDLRKHYVRQFVLDELWIMNNRNDMFIYFNLVLSCRCTQIFSDGIDS